MTERGFTEHDLDRFWNDLVAGTTAGDDGRIDPGDAAMIRMLRDLAKEAQPQGGRDRVRATVDAAIERLERGSRANGRVLLGHVDAAPLAPDRGPRRQNEAAATRSSFDPRRRPRSWIAAACAVLVVAIIAAGLRWGWWSGADDPERVPAFAAPTVATPPVATPPGATGNDLFAITIPAETIVPGPASVGLHHVTLLPGARLSSAWAVYNVHVWYVDSGDLSLTANSAAQVRRAGQIVWDPVPAGTEVALTAGDAALFLDRAEIAFANPSGVPAEIVVYGLVFAGAGDSGGSFAGWILNDESLAEPGIVLSDQPVEIRFSRELLGPAAEFPPGPADRFQLVIGMPVDDRGTPVIPILHDRADGAVRNVRTTSTPLYVVTLEVPGRAGTPIAVQPDA